MKNIWIFVVLIVITVVVLVLLQMLKTGTMRELSKMLYQQNDPDGFIKELNTFKSKFFFSKKVRNFQVLDAYLIKNDKTKVVEMFKELEGSKLNFGQAVNLYQKEVQFYTQNNMSAQAVAANNNVQALSEKIKDDRMSAISQECNTLIKVYVDKDGSVAKQLVKMGDEAPSPSAKGIYYYQAAKCFNYQKDKAMTTKYLKEAQLKLSGTSWDKHITKCLEDFKYLDER